MAHDEYGGGSRHEDRISGAQPRERELRRAVKRTDADHDRGGPERKGRHCRADRERP